jgi:hypothetical protein
LKSKGELAGLGRARIDRGRRSERFSAALTPMPPPVWAGRPPLAEAPFPAVDSAPAGVRLPEAAGSAAIRKSPTLARNHPDKSRKTSNRIPADIFPDMAIRFLAVGKGDKSEKMNKTYNFGVEAPCGH